MKLIPLGSNGYFPSFNRQSACYLVLGLKELIILDAGSGLFRFAEPFGKKILKEYLEIHLFLSHYHLDHTFGFYAMNHFFKDKRVKVFGSEKKQVFRELVDLKHFPIDYDKVFESYEWETLKSGINENTDYKVCYRQQYHRGQGSLAYRFEFKNGKKLVYATDNEPNQESVEFAKGADLLMHEHDCEKEGFKFDKDDKIEKLFNGAHTTTAGACLVAKEANVGKLVLIHHNAFMSNEELQNDEKQAKKLFKDTFLARDLEEIEF